MGEQLCCWGRDLHDEKPLRWTIKVLRSVEMCTGAGFRR
jgi:hypothetical protein